jgi:protein tyrosine phosphatase (PTP) superfamily phosphohydrolase (DUF442 family)
MGGNVSLLTDLQGTANINQPLPWLATSGQPSVDNLHAARDAGVTMVIDLRDPMEGRPFDEPATVAELGLRYLNIPVNNGALKPESITLLMNTLREQAGQPTLLHCASANRVGGALIPWFILEEGMDEQAAVDLAMQVGLRSAELMEWGMGYVRDSPK